MISKPWTTFFNKLHLYHEKDINYWNHYDLLGYWSDQSGMIIQLEKTSPRLHPQMIKMRKLIALLHNLDLMPTEYDSALVKDYLDWCLNLLQHQFKEKLNITSLSYIVDHKMIKLYRDNPHKLFNSNQEIDIKYVADNLDIGD